MAGRKPKSPSYDGVLQKYEHHQRMASKHRAHADLLEAKLRVHGKRIEHVYGDSSGPSEHPKKLRVVDAHG